MDVSTVVVTGDRGLHRPACEAIRRERIEQWIAAEARDLAGEQLCGEGREEDSPATPAVERVETGLARVFADEGALVRGRVVDAGPLTDDPELGEARRLLEHDACRAAEESQARRLRHARRLFGIYHAGHELAAKRLIEPSLLRAIEGHGRGHERSA